LPKWKEVAPTGWLPEFLNKITGKEVRSISWLSSFAKIALAKIKDFFYRENGVMKNELLSILPK